MGTVLEGQSVCSRSAKVPAARPPSPEKVQRMNFKYAAIPDKPDKRDHLAATPSPGAASVAQVDLREWFPPIRNQGQEGACTMFAGTAILSWLYKRFKNQDNVFS